MHPPVAKAKPPTSPDTASARERGLDAGCAPDTLLGAGLQTWRRRIDGGTVGDLSA